MRHPFRRKNLSPRLLPCYALAALAFALAEPSAPGFAVGGAFAVAGLAVRFWGAGHLIKTRRLTVGGPYAYLRHPLYAGTLLLGIGFACMAGPWGIALGAVVFLPAFFFYYLPYKERVEGGRLEARYGEPYAAYRREVPALLPTAGRWTPPPELDLPGPSHWSFARVRANDELGTGAAVLVAVVALALF